jgi:predicted negative regulator of RcsB-dependent stress response
VEELSEKEQIEEMRAWWSEYGNYVMGGIVVGIALMVGIGQYRSNTENTQIEASALYETVFEAVADGKTEDAEAAASELYADYASTVYPAQARLAMARLYMDKGRDKDAADTLSSLVDAEPDSELGLIARLRLAKVLLYQDKPQEVIDLLSNLEDSAFTPRYSEVIADGHVMLGQYSDARDAYLLAMADSATMPTVDRVLVQMKFDDLPEIEMEEAGDMEEAGAEESVDESSVETVTDEEAPTDGDEASE